MRPAWKPWPGPYPSRLQRPCPPGIPMATTAACWTMELTQTTGLHSILTLPSWTAAIVRHWIISKIGPTSPEGTFQTWQPPPTRSGSQPAARTWPRPSRAHTQALRLEACRCQRHSMCSTAFRMSALVRGSPPPSAVPPQPASSGMQPISRPCRCHFHRHSHRR